MRRLITLGVALVLAIAGTLLLIAYVRGAEDRALEGQELVSVYVVTEAVAAGAPLDTLRQAVTLRDIPAFAVGSGPVSDLETLTGLVPIVDLIPGEQLLSARFANPADLETDTRPVVTPDLLQFSIELPAERTIGGRLIPGDFVAVFASFEPFSLSGTDPLGESSEGVPIIPIPIDPETGEPDEDAILVVGTPHSTSILLNKILVTAVQYQSDEMTGSNTVVPSGSVMVTLATTADSAERLVFAMEFGRVWLARQDPAAPEPVTPVRTRLNIFR